MSAGFYLTSSFIYINMGAEMMFVLSNRMNAQNIDMNTGKPELMKLGQKYYPKSPKLFANPNLSRK